MLNQESRWRVHFTVRNKNVVAAQLSFPLKDKSCCLIATMIKRKNIRGFINSA